MIKEGQLIEIIQGAFKDQKGIVKQFSNIDITVEIDLFGRKADVKLPYSDFGLEHQPQYVSFKLLLTEFNDIYKEKAPLRYAHLNQGITPEAFFSIEVFKTTKEIPEDFMELLKWKNGLSYTNGWQSEFETDKWYEIIPLNEIDHFMSADSIASTIQMWEDILTKSKENNQLCYWRKGFIPFLMRQHFGLVVIDTVGYFEGQPGQIIYFDYKCDNGYSIIHENINKWLETQLVLLKQGLLFPQCDLMASTQVEKELNYYYTSRFAHPILLS